MDNFLSREMQHFKMAAKSILKETCRNRAHYLQSDCPIGYQMRPCTFLWSREEQICSHFTFIPGLVTIFTSNRLKKEMISNIKKATKKN